MFEIGDNSILAYSRAIIVFCLFDKNINRIEPFTSI